MSTTFDKSKPATSDNYLDCMRWCLSTARKIEDLSVQLHSCHATAQAGVAAAEEAFKAAIEKGKLARGEAVKTAEEQYAAAVASAQQKHTQVMDTARAKLARFDLVMAGEGSSGEENEPVEALARAMDDQVHLAQDRLKIIEQYRMVFCWNNAAVVAFGTLIFLAVMSAILNPVLQSAGGGWLACMLSGAVMVWHYASQQQGLTGAKGTMQHLGERLRVRAKHDLNLLNTAAAEELAKARSAADSNFERAAELANASREKAIELVKSKESRSSKALRTKVEDIYQELITASDSFHDNFTTNNWQAGQWDQWSTSKSYPGCTRIGTAIPRMPHFSSYFPHLTKVEIPALIDYENGNGILIRAGHFLSESRDLAQSVITRLLSTVPPAGVRFVFIDPVSLGGNVAAFMALEKYESALIGGKAWSDARHIETALAEVTDHMETVIQKYLRQDFKSIAEYNASARVKEAYRIVVIFDFPVNMTDTSAKRLISIFRNGPRCGVFPIVVVDESKEMPYGTKLADLSPFATLLCPTGDRLKVSN